MWHVLSYVCGVNHNTLHLTLKTMRKHIIYSAITIAFITLSAFTVQHALKKGYAEVEQEKGIYIFVNSKPLMEYEFLGEIKSNTGGFGSTQYTEVRNRLVDKCAKEYPRADGMILHFRSGKADVAEAIRFKE